MGNSAFTLTSYKSMIKTYPYVAVCAGVVDIFTMNGFHRRNLGKYDGLS